MLATGSPRISHRRPVGRLALVLLGIGALFVTGVFATAAGAYVWPDDPWPPTQTTIVGQAEDFAPGSVTHLRDVGVLGYLVRLPDGELLAFDRHEPVWGCTLVWGRHRETGFWDPCHGFEYDITGQPSPDNPVLLPMTPLEVHIDRYDTIRVVTPTVPQ